MGIQKLKRTHILLFFWKSVFYWMNEAINRTDKQYCLSLNTKSGMKNRFSSHKMNKWIGDGWTDNFMEDREACLKWGTVQTTAEMPPLGKSKMLLLPLPAGCQSSDRHTCTAAVWGLSNEAPLSPCHEVSAAPVLKWGRPRWARGFEALVLEVAAASPPTEQTFWWTHAVVLSKHLPFCCSWTRGVRSSALSDPGYARPVMYWAADKLSNETCLI